MPEMDVFDYVLAVMAGVVFYFFWRLARISILRALAAIMVAVLFVQAFLLISSTAITLFQGLLMMGVMTAVFLLTAYLFPNTDA